MVVVGVSRVVVVRVDVEEVVVSRHPHATGQIFAIADASHIWVVSASNGHRLSFRPSVHTAVEVEVVAVVAGHPQETGQNADITAELHTVAIAASSSADGQIVSSVLPSLQAGTGVDVVVVVATGQPHTTGQNSAAAGTVHVAATFPVSPAPGQNALSTRPSGQAEGTVGIDSGEVVVGAISFVLQPQSTGQNSCPASDSHVAAATSASPFAGQNVLSNRPSEHVGFDGVPVTAVLVVDSTVVVVIVVAVAVAVVPVAVVVVEVWGVVAVVFAVVVNVAMFSQPQSTGQTSRPAFDSQAAAAASTSPLFGQNALSARPSAHFGSDSTAVISTADVLVLAVVVLSV